MSTLRHWRQRWSPTADLVFLKRLKMGDGQVVPGDPVTPAIREKLGLHRLRRWWDAGVICRTDQPLPRRIAALLKPAPQTDPIITRLGGPWMQVRMPDGSMHKVNGNKALARLIGA